MPESPKVSKIRRRLLKNFTAGREPPGRPRRKVLVVHLGNVGYEHETLGGIKIELRAEKTRRLLERFGGSKNIDLKVIGIDRRRYPGRMPTEWEQKRADFKSGLGELKDGTVDLISSELALGHYAHNGEEYQNVGGAGEYTAKTLRVARRKLKPGGKLMVVATENAFNVSLKDGLRRARFDPDKTEVRELKPEEVRRTFWTASMDKTHGRYQKHTLYQITAVK